MGNLCYVNLTYDCVWMVIIVIETKINKPIIEECPNPECNYKGCWYFNYDVIEGRQKLPCIKCTHDLLEDHPEYREMVEEVEA